MVLLLLGCSDREGLWAAQVPPLQQILALKGYLQQHLQGRGREAGLEIDLLGTRTGAKGTAAAEAFWDFLHPTGCAGSRG